MTRLPPTPCPRCGVEVHPSALVTRCPQCFGPLDEPLPPPAAAPEGPAAPEPIQPLAKPQTAPPPPVSREPIAGLPVARARNLAGLWAPVALAVAVPFAACLSVISDVVVGCISAGLVSMTLILGLVFYRLMLGRAAATVEILPGPLPISVALGQRVPYSLTLRGRRGAPLCQAVVRLLCCLRFADADGGFPEVGVLAEAGGVFGPPVDLPAGTEARVDGELIVPDYAAPTLSAQHCKVHWEARADVWVGALHVADALIGQVNLAPVLQKAGAEAHSWRPMPLAHASCSRSGLTADMTPVDGADIEGVPLLTGGAEHRLCLRLSAEQPVRVRSVSCRLAYRLEEDPTEAPFAADLLNFVLDPLYPPEPMPARTEEVVVETQELAADLALEAK